MQRNLSPWRRERREDNDDGDRLGFSDNSSTQSREPWSDRPFRQRNSNTETNWRNLYIITLVFFLVRTQFTVYLASIWPILQATDKEATGESYSLMSAAYNIGVGSAAPVFGWLVDKHGFTRPALAALLLMLLSDIGYFWLDVFPEPRRYFFFAIRFLVGIASGATTIFLVFWSHGAAPDDRTVGSSLSAAASAAGNIAGPLVQAVCSLLDYPGFRWHGLPIHMYSIPAVVSAFLVLVSTFLLLRFFRDEHRVQPAESTVDPVQIELEGEKEEKEPLDVACVCFCLFLSVIQQFLYSNIETVAPLYHQWMFDLNNKETTTFGSLLIVLAAVVSLIFLAAYVWSGAARRVDNRLGISMGLFVCFSFVVAVYPYKGIYSLYIESPFCHFDWCSSTVRISLRLYICAYAVLFGVGFILLSVHTSALLSLLLGSRRQQMWHGISSLVGTAARAVGPLCCVRLLELRGPSLVWLSQLLLLALALFVIALSWCRMGTRIHRAGAAKPSPSLARKLSLKSLH